MNYRVDVSETAEVEIDRIYLWILRRSPERASVWYEGFLREIESLSEMPRRCPLSRDDHGYAGEVRQLLYGRARNAYRVIFSIIESDDPSQESIVRVLHVRHAMRELLEGDFAS